MNDLWPDFDEMEPLESNNALKILREQSRNLGKKTKNKVKATFSKIQYTDTLKGMASAFDVFTTLSASCQVSNREVLEDELKGKENISDELQEQQYKFEIYNSVYRYRLFVYVYSKIYPNRVLLDENIAEDIGKTTTISIESDQKLNEILGLIFSSKHVARIIKLMMLESNNKENN